MSASVAQRRSNLISAMHVKTAELLGHGKVTMHSRAADYYKVQGRGAMLIKFMDTEELLTKSKRLVLLYVPLELSLRLEYAELSRQIQVYTPPQEYVMVLCVSTSLVEGGELMLASTARPRPRPRPPSSSPLLLEPRADDVTETETETKALTQAVEFCGYCYTDSPNFRCGRCASTMYCSKSCQRAHWAETHKSSCSSGVMLD
jgi:hypothetical protein